MLAVVEQVAALALAFPETSRVDKGRHAQFLVRKKSFAYFLDDHHGDGIVAFCCKVLKGDNASLVKSDPKRFYLPAYLASSGWVAYRLDVAGVDWEDARELLRTSYVLCAPKKLADAVAAWNFDQTRP